MHLFVIMLDIILKITFSMLFLRFCSYIQTYEEEEKRK